MTDLKNILLANEHNIIRLPLAPIPPIGVAVTELKHAQQVFNYGADNVYVIVLKPDGTWVKCHNYSEAFAAFKEVTPMVYEVLKFGSMTLDVFDKGYLVLTAETKDTFKVVEMKGTHPSIVTDIIAEGLTFYEMIGNSEIITKHNVRITKQH